MNNMLNILKFKARLIQLINSSFLEYLRLNTKFRLDVLYVILKVKFLLNRYPLQRAMCFHFGKLNVYYGNGIHNAYPCRAI